MIGTTVATGMFAFNHTLGNFWYTCLGGAGGLAASILACIYPAGKIMDRMLGNRVKAKWNETMSQEALIALCGMTPHPGAEEILVRISEEPLSLQSRKQVATAFGRGESSVSFETIKTQLHSDNEETRLMYLEALAQRREPEAEELLRVLKTDVNPDIRVRATQLSKERKSRHPY